MQSLHDQPFLVFGPLFEILAEIGKECKEGQLCIRDCYIAYHLIALGHPKYGLVDC